MNWFKAGLFAVAIYFSILFALLLIFIFGGVISATSLHLYVMTPLMFLASYPALVVVGNYEAVLSIFLINVLCYFCLGSFFTFVKNWKKG